MSGKFDQIDVAATKSDAHAALCEAEQALKSTLKAMKYINRSEGKTYDLTDTKQALKKIAEAKEQL